MERNKKLCNQNWSP